MRFFLMGWAKRAVNPQVKSKNSRVMTWAEEKFKVEKGRGATCKLILGGPLWRGPSSEMKSWCQRWEGARISLLDRVERLT